jgi:outer membrane biosynthesis protein TonB
MKGRNDPPDRVAIAGSLAVHGLAIVLAWWSTTAARPPLVFESYEIELVSPPPAEVAEVVQPAQEELVVETPTPEPAEQEEAPVTQPDPPEPTPDPPPREDPEPLPPEPEEEVQPATTEDAPEEEIRESGEDINVRIEGLRRDYPVYYDNIIRQIQRCFAGRFRGEGSWETTIYFVIHADGTAANLDFVTRSGNTSFDFEAMGAVECAGRGRFGPLPDDLPYERLPIQFTFRPSGGIGDLEMTLLPTNQTEGPNQR